MKTPLRPSYKIDITKEEIEKELGCEIENFKIEPIYDKDSMTGLTIIIQPKIHVKFIKIKLTPTSLGMSTDLN